MITEVPLPGTPPEALAAAWPRWEQARQLAMLAHLLHAETSTRFIKRWMRIWGCEISLSELDTYRAAILAPEEPAPEPTTE